MMTPSELLHHGGNPGGDITFSTPMTCFTEIKLLSLDPLRLLDEIRSMQRHIAGLGRGEQAHTPPQRHADLERFLASLATAWMDGEVRPTHRAKPTAARYWRTRQDPFEEVWPKVLVWLDSEPDHTAKNSSSDCVRSTQVR